MARTKQTARKETGGKTTPSERTNQINDGSPQQNKLPTSTSCVNTSVNMDNNNNTKKQPPPTPATTSQNNLVPHTNMIDNTNNTLQQKQLSSRAPTLTTTAVDGAPSNMNLDDFKMDIDSLVGLGDEGVVSNESDTLNTGMDMDMLLATEGTPNTCTMNQTPRECEEFENWKRTFDATTAHPSTDEQSTNTKRQKASHTSTPTLRSRVLEGDGGLVSTQDLQPHDILCGKGSHGDNNPATINYRKLVCSRKQDYAVAKKGDKKKISESIVDEIRAKGGRFLKLEGGMWKEIGDEKAVTKVSQALRENRVGHQSSGNRKDKNTAAVLKSNDSKSPPLPTTVPTSLSTSSKASSSTATGTSNNNTATKTDWYSMATGKSVQEEIISPTTATKASVDESISAAASLKKARRGTFKEVVPEGGVKATATTSVEHPKANDTSDGAVPTSLSTSSKASSFTATDTSNTNTTATKSLENETALLRTVSNDESSSGVAAAEVEDPILSQLANDIDKMQKSILAGRSQEVLHVLQQVNTVMEMSSNKNVDGIIRLFDIAKAEIEGVPAALLAEKSKLQDSVDGLQKTLAPPVVTILDSKTKSGLEIALEVTKAELKNVNAKLARAKKGEEEQNRLKKELREKTMKLYDAKEADFMAEDEIELSGDYAAAERLRLNNHIYKNSSK